MDNIKINVPHFYCLEYKQGLKKISVDIDFREPKIEFGKKMIKQWDPPYDKEKITEEEKETIYKNIMNYLLKSYSKNDIINVG